jgi:hypothetical protein
MITRKPKSSDEPSPREKREMIERGEWIEEGEEEVPNRAPLVFRLLAWASLIVIFFAVGYGATSLAFKWLDSRGAHTPPNVVATPEEAENLLRENEKLKTARVSPPRSADAAAAGAPDNSLTVTISVPDGGTFRTRRIKCGDALREDAMKQTLAAYMDAVKELKLLNAGARELNLFQSGDWLYVNMNGEFLESMKSIGAEKSRLMLTGMVKTISDNFEPINKLKFYIDGKEAKDKKPVDLSAPWGISAKSG